MQTHSDSHFFSASISLSLTHTHTGETALFFRLDHALGDGFALKNWLMSLTDEIGSLSSMKSLWTDTTGRSCSLFNLHDQIIIELRDW